MVLNVITLEIDGSGVDDVKLVIVFIIETVGVSVGIDAFAELVEVDVIVFVFDRIADFDEVVDTVFDCKADDESEFIFETEASEEKVETAD